jgi:Na+/melibiose symporter-like transporter
MLVDPGGEQHDQERHEEKVPFWRTFYYAFGNAAGQLTYTTFNTYIQYFYTTVIGL